MSTVGANARFSPTIAQRTPAAVTRSAGRLPSLFSCAKYPFATISPQCVPPASVTCRSISTTPRLRPLVVQQLQHAPSGFLVDPPISLLERQLDALVGLLMNRRHGDAAHDRVGKPRAQRGFQRPQLPCQPPPYRRIRDLRSY